MSYLEESAGRNYVERTREEFDALLVEQMGFSVVPLEGTYEVVYQRQVVSKNGVEHPYLVRVYSSVLGYQGKTRDCGADAIRVVLIPLEGEYAGRPTKVLGEGKGKAGRRINRTKGAMENLRKRVTQYFQLVIKYRCPKCGSLMAVRNSAKGKFLGCRSYPECNGSRPLPEELS